MTGPRVYGGTTFRDRVRTKWYRFEDRLQGWWYRFDYRFLCKPAEQDCPRKRDATMGIQRRHKTKWRRDGTCSYCGSLKSDLFFAAIDRGVELVPTDKNYKVYLQGPEAPNVRGAAKFYFQHLDKDEKKAFVDMLNTKYLNIGIPGHFYRPPYFVSFEKPPDKPVE